ncbi:hypothetical protein FOL47_010627 [Perkinsus chesapeaki]|uniref:F5/8 type C domain-containing protein n=1 Tax=Perkinsus chesapeaki TaxID=330153 RepID=A0A7J6MQZ2_PERCH|nr:hypothetical protein FOL47_010627 [Perkinsus chesapeaki]
MSPSVMGWAVLLGLAGSQGSGTCRNVELRSLGECERCLSDDQCSVSTNATHTIPLVCSNVQKKCVKSQTELCPGQDDAQCLLGCEDQSPPYACATATYCLNEDFPCNWIPGCSPPDQMDLGMSACLRGCPDHTGMLSVVYGGFEGTGSCESAKSRYGCTHAQGVEPVVPVGKFCPETCGDPLNECSDRCRRDEAPGEDGLVCWDRVHGAASLTCTQATASGYDCHCTCYGEYFRKYSGGPFELGRDVGLYRNFSVELSEAFGIELTGVGLDTGGEARLKLVYRSSSCTGQQIRGVEGLEWEEAGAPDAFYPFGDTPPTREAQFWHRWDGVTVSQCGEFKICHCNGRCDQETVAVWREAGVVRVLLPEGVSEVALSSNALAAESCFPPASTTATTPFDMWAIVTTTARPDVVERARVSGEVTMYGELVGGEEESILRGVKDAVMEILEITDGARVSVEVRDSRRRRRRRMQVTSTTVAPGTTTTVAPPTAPSLLHDSGLCEDQDAYLVQESVLRLGGALLDTCAATAQLIGVSAACDDANMGELMRTACRVSCDSCEGGSRAPVAATTEAPIGEVPGESLIVVVAVETFYQSERVAAVRWLRAVRDDVSATRELLIVLRRTLDSNGATVPDTLWVNVTSGPTAAAVRIEEESAVEEGSDGGNGGVVVAVIVVVKLLLLGGCLFAYRRRKGLRYKGEDEASNGVTLRCICPRRIATALSWRHNKVVPADDRRTFRKGSEETPLHVGAVVRLKGLRRVEYNGLDGIIKSGPIEAGEEQRWNVLVTIYESETETETKEISLKEMNLVVLENASGFQPSYRKRSLSNGLSSRLGFVSSDGVLSSETLPRGKVELYEVPSSRGPVGHDCEFRSSKQHGRNECLSLLKLIDVPDSDIIPGHIENSSRWLIGKSMSSLTQIPRFVDSIRYAPECILEPFWPKGSTRTEDSIQSFVNRRFSRWAARRFADVFAASQCGAAASDVSLRSCVPHAYTTERWRRSVLWGPFLDTLRPSSAAPAGDLKLDLPVDVDEFLRRSVATGGRVWTVKGGYERLEKDLARFVEGNPAISQEGQLLDRSDVSSIACDPAAQAVVSVMSPGELLPLVSQELLGLSVEAAEALAAVTEVEVLDLYWHKDGVLKKPFKGNAGVWTGVDNGEDCRIFGFSFGSEIFPGIDPEFGTKVTVYAKKGASKDKLYGRALEVLGISAPPDHTVISHDSWPAFPLGHSQALLEFNRLRAAQMPSLSVAGCGWYVGESLGKVIGDLSSGVLGRLVKRLEVSGFVERERPIDWANRSGHCLLGKPIAAILRSQLVPVQVPILAGMIATIVRSDIDIDRFRVDPTGSLTGMHVLLDAEIGFFSTEFQEEYCNDTAMAQVIDDSRTQPRSPDYFRFQQMRTDEPLAPRQINVYQGPCPPTHPNAFAYLDSSQAGKVVNKSYTYVCRTTDWVPDGGLDPLPHSRPQICVYGARLVSPKPERYGGVFFKEKQAVAYGFETTFYFTVLHASLYCPISAPTSEGRRWCMPQGGRGFAFVVQNEGSPPSLEAKIAGSEAGQLGYSFARNLAVEFDFFFDAGSNDATWNHVAVMVPWAKQANEGETANSGDHAVNMLAEATGDRLPQLRNGTHKVTIRYDVQNGEPRWDRPFTGWSTDFIGGSQQLYALENWVNGRVGALSVEINGQLVINTLVDLAKVVRADGVQTYEHPNVTKGEDDPRPGNAWVGFVAATDVEQFAAPTILSWKLRTHDRCPGGDYSELVGAVSGVGRKGVVSSGVAVCDNEQRPLDTLQSCTGISGNTHCAIVIQNVGRTAVEVSAIYTDALLRNGTNEATAGQSALSSVKSYRSRPCRNGLLEWDQMHPYFLGCQKEFRFTNSLGALVITSQDGTRSVKVDDTHLLNIATGAGTVSFKKRSLFHYCVMEHRYNPYRLYFAQCNCDYCTRVFAMQNMYSVFHQERCGERYGFTCTCLEASQMTWDALDSSFAVTADPWRQLPPVGGLNEGRPLLQYQKHSVCRGCKYDSHCGYVYKAGTCSRAYQVYRIGYPTAPQVTPKPQFLYWADGNGLPGNGEVKGDTCDCKDMGDGVNNYLNVRGQMQSHAVFLLRTLQRTRQECFDCLSLYDAEFCKYQCGPPTRVPFLHWPAGQSCATCMFAGPKLLELNYFYRNQLKECAYSAINAGNDPWSACQELAVSLPPLFENTTDLFNGVATHFLTECPGRDFTEVGAVCAPNLLAMNTLPSQVLSRFSAINNTVWYDGLECINAICELTSRDKCYTKLARFVFNDTTGCHDSLGSGLGCHIENGAPIVGGAMILDKEQKQWAYTDPLPAAWGQLADKTLEVWVTVNSSEEVTNLGVKNSTTSTVTSEWSEAYASEMAVDGDMSTYWSSHVSVVRNFEATWEVDFNGTIYAEETVIHWFHRPLDFDIEVSLDGGSSWTIVDTYEDNSLNTTTSTVFFAAEMLRISMHRAATVRGPGPSANLFVYSIREVEVKLDTNIARLKPVSFVNRWNYPPAYAFDGDDHTWWSAQPGQDSAWLRVDLGQIRTAVSLIRVRFRKGYVPGAVDFSYSSDGSSWSPLACSTSTCDTVSTVQSMELPFDHIPGGLSLRHFQLAVSQGAPYYSSSILQIAEVELYAWTDANLASNLVYPHNLTCINERTLVPCADPSLAVDNLTNASFIMGVSDAIVMDVAAATGAGVSLGRFEVQLDPAFPARSFSWLISMDNGLSYREIYSATQNTVSNPNPFTYKSHAPIQKVKLVIEQPHSNAATAGVVEVRIFGLTSNLALGLDSTYNYVAGTSWLAAEAGEGIFVTRGDPIHAIDGDDSTDFRVPYGARQPSYLSITGVSATGAVSDVTDFGIIVDLNARLPIDVVHLRLSYRSAAFRVQLRDGATESWRDSCFWSPALGDLGLLSTEDAIEYSCPSGRIVKIDPFNYYFAMRIRAFGTFYRRFLRVTLMKDSMVDRAGDDWIMGLAAIEAYSAFDNIAITSTPLATQITAPSADTSLAVDGDLETFWYTDVPASQQPTYTLDLGSCVNLSKVILWFGAQAYTAGEFVIQGSSDCADYSDPGESYGPGNANQVQHGSCLVLMANHADRAQAPSFPSTEGVYLSVTHGCLQCIRVTFKAGPPDGLVRIAEIEVKRADAAFQAIYESSLIGAQFALDGVAASAARTLDAEGVHYLQVTLANVEDVWGVRAIFEASSFPRAYTLGICLEPIVSDCDWSSLTVYTTDLNKDSSIVIKFTTRPALHLMFTLRLPAELAESSLSLRPNTRPSIDTFSTEYRLEAFEVYQSGNLALSNRGASAVSNAHWDHSASKAVDGVDSTFWVSEVDANEADLIITLRDIATAKVLHPYFVSRVVFKFRDEPLDFDVYLSLDKSSWSLFKQHRGNTAKTVVISEYFQANYIKLSMTRRAYDLASADGLWQPKLYSIYSVDVTFDTQLQLGKSIWSDTQASAAEYYPDQALDDLDSTFWIPNPGAAASPSATFEFASPGSGTEVSGILFTWLAAPREFSIYYWNLAQAAWSPPYSFTGLTITGNLQSTYLRKGFTCDRFRVTVEASNNYQSVPLTALRSLRVYTPGTKCTTNTCWSGCCFGGFEASDYTEHPLYAFDGLSASKFSVNVGSLETWIRAYVSSSPATDAMIGKIRIIWNSVNICKRFSVDLEDRSGEYTEVMSFTENTDEINEVLLLRPARRIWVRMHENVDPLAAQFRIAEIEVWRAEDNQQPTGATAEASDLFTTDPANAISPNNSTMWMSIPGPPQEPGSITLDLLAVYPVDMVRCLWGMQPASLGDRFFEVSEDAVSWTEIRVIGPVNLDEKLEQFTGFVRLRYLRVSFVRPFDDAANEPNRIGMSIRNLYVRLDQNLARWHYSVTRTGTWSFPSGAALDGSRETYWSTKQGVEDAVFTVYFSELFNLAGIYLEFLYRAIDIYLYQSTDCISFNLVESIIDNQEYVFYVPTTTHFQARCIRVNLSGARDRMWHPDRYEDGDSRLRVIAVKEFTLLEHAGGGGVFGIEDCYASNCGLRYDTITYGLRQPREWSLASEGDTRSRDVLGAKENTTQLVQVVVVFGGNIITLYRNGQKYGQPYNSSSASPSIWNNNSRLIMGVRSSAYVNLSTASNFTGTLLEGIVGLHDDSHNNFFSGAIHSVTLLRGALLSEEVMGLYESHFGKPERACHCGHRVCPSGPSSFLPWVQVSAAGFLHNAVGRCLHITVMKVPCSGQGVCVRNVSADGLTQTGSCTCIPGYSGKPARRVKMMSIDGQVRIVVSTAPTMEAAAKLMTTALMGNGVIEHLTAV